MIEHGRAARSTTSTGSWSATAISSRTTRRAWTSCWRRWPGGWRRCRRLMASMSPGAAGRAPGALRAGPAGHGPGVRGEPAGVERWRAVPGDAVGRADAGAATATSPMPMSATVDALERHARLRGPGPVDARATTRARPSTTWTRRRCAGSLGEDAVHDLRRLKEVERALERGRPDDPHGRPPGGHAARRAQAGRARAGAGVRAAAARPRGRARGPRRRAAWPSRPGATRPWRFGDTGQIAVQRTVFNAVVRRSAGSPTRLHARRLRAGRGRSAHRGRDGAPAGPVVLACRCAGTGSPRSGWRWRCTR